METDSGSKANEPEAQGLDLHLCNMAEVSARQELTVLRGSIKIFPFNVKTCSAIEKWAGLLKQKHMRKI